MNRNIKRYKYLFFHILLLKYENLNQFMCSSGMTEKNN